MVNENLAKALPNSRICDGILHVGADIVAGAPAGRDFKRFLENQGSARIEYC